MFRIYVTWVILAFFIFLKYLSHSDTYKIKHQSKWIHGEIRLSTVSIGAGPLVLIFFCLFGMLCVLLDAPLFI